MEHQIKLCYKYITEKSVNNFHSDGDKRTIRVSTALNVEKLIITEKSSAYMVVAKKYLTQIYINISVKAVKWLKM